MVRFIVKLLALIGLMVLYMKNFNGQEYVWTMEGTGYKSIAIFIVALALLNAFLRPILNIIAIPLNCLTMGLFSFVINFGLTYLADELVDDFAFVNLKITFLFSLAFSLVSSIIDFFLRD